MSENMASISPSAMGVGTIMESREVLLLASGERKAKVVAKAIEGPVTSENAASKLNRGYMPFSDRAETQDEA